ncbi:MAG: tetratricopeptide repeat protein [Alphaproteobacteria bacterium]
MRRLSRALRITVVLAAAVVVCAAARAGPFEDGVEAYNRGDYATALELFRPLAEQGLAEAQSYLGVMYDNGEGVARDDAESVKWFRLAAEQGYAEALANLGVMYAQGQGVPQDYVLAHMWLSLAASKLPTGAQRDVAEVVRDAVANEMTPDQIAEAQRLAQEWSPN